MRRTWLIGRPAPAPLAQLRAALETAQPGWGANVDPENVGRLPRPQRDPVTRAFTAPAVRLWWTGWQMTPAEWIAVRAAVLSVPKDAQGRPYVVAVRGPAYGLESDADCMSEESLGGAEPDPAIDKLTLRTALRRIAALMGLSIPNDTEI